MKFTIKENLCYFSILIFSIILVGSGIGSLIYLIFGITFKAYIIINLVASLIIGAWINKILNK